MRKVRCECAMSEFFPLRQSGNKNYCALCGFSASFAVSFYMKISQFYIELTSNLTGLCRMCRITG